MESISIYLAWLQNKIASACSVVRLCIFIEYIFYYFVDFLFLFSQLKIQLGKATCLWPISIEVISLADTLFAFLLLSLLPCTAVDQTNVPPLSRLCDYVSTSQKKKKKTSQQKTAKSKLMQKRSGPRIGRLVKGVEFGTFCLAKR